ncbi:hypothetical protein FKM82_002185 [Ascaphus truei]
MGHSELAFLLLAVFTLHVSSQPRKFELVKTAMTWEDARNYCRKNYVDLADIKDVSELASLVTNTLAFQTAWIGLYYDTATGSVRWSTGASYSWTPNILLTEGNCAAIYTLPLPAPCTSEKSFICLYCMYSFQKKPSISSPYTPITVILYMWRYCTKGSDAIPNYSYSPNAILHIVC